MSTDSENVSELIRAHYQRSFGFLIWTIIFFIWGSLIPRNDGGEINISYAALTGIPLYGFLSYIFLKLREYLVARVAFYMCFSSVVLLLIVFTVNFFVTY